MKVKNDVKDDTYKTFFLKSKMIFTTYLIFNQREKEKLHNFSTEC